MIEINSVYNDDCLNVLKYIPDNSIDVVITDPPYGIGFSRQRWGDKLPSDDIYRELCRVLKPNALALVFSYKLCQHQTSCQLEDAGFKLRDVLLWIVSGKAVKGYYTDAARHWNTELRTSYEPIIVAAKRSSMSIGDSMRHYGTGAFHVAANRIGDEILPAGETRRPLNYKEFRYSDDWETEERIGRYPNNIVFDEDAREGLPEQALNYFYACICRPQEKHIGCEHLLNDWVLMPNGLYRHKIFEGLEVRKPVANYHPTVKPLALMRWLCRLVTRKNGVILDPFAGSGTTLLAAMLEGFNFIGIEKQPEYIPIIEGRLNAIERYQCL